MQMDFRRPKRRERLAPMRQSRGSISMAAPSQGIAKVGVGMGAWGGKRPDACAAARLQKPTRAAVARELTALI